MRFDPDNEYDENRPCFSISDTVAGFEIEAYCSPDSNGLTYAGGQPVQNDDGEKFGAPFQVDIVLDEGTVISHSENLVIREAIGGRFAEQFEQKKNAVYEMIEDADDPLDAIMELESDA